MARLVVGNAQLINVNTRHPLSRTVMGTIASAIEHGSLAAPSMPPAAGIEFIERQSAVS
jgi:hypothetical protein